jgi:hypothetical protein
MPIEGRFHRLMAYHKLEEVLDRTFGVVSKEPAAPKPHIVEPFRTNPHRGFAAVPRSLVTHYPANRVSGKP